MSRAPRHERLLPRASALGLAWCGGLASGCFDAHEVADSGSALVWSTARTVDDAERPDGSPTWSMLQRWGSWSSPESGTATLQTVEPGSGDRGRARSLTFDVEPEPTDTEPDPAKVFTSAGLYAIGAIELDLSGYDEFVFSAKVEPDTAYPWPGDLELRIHLDCYDDAGGGGEGSSATHSVQSAVAPVAGAGWQTFSLTMADFIQPSWETEARPESDPTSCLRQVKTIGVDVAANAPGVRLAGTLTLDDLELRTLRRARTRALRDVTLSPWACYDLDGVPDPSCTVPPYDALVTLAEGPDGDGGQLVGQVRCASVLSLDDDSVLQVAEVDLTGFDELRVGATFLPANPGDRRPGRFSVRLGCFDQTEHPATMVRSFGVSSGLASYQLGLSSFERDYSLKPQPCLAHVDGICLETSKPTSDAVAGTLSIEELVLR